MSAPLDPRHAARFQRGHQDGALPEPAPERAGPRSGSRPPAQRPRSEPADGPLVGQRRTVRRGRPLHLVGAGLILLGVVVHFTGWVLPYLPVDVEVMRTTGSATQRIGWAITAIAPAFVTAGCTALILSPLLRAASIASAVRARSVEEQGRPRADEQGRTERQAGSAT